MFYRRETGGDEWDVGVWAFRGGGANGLVGAASAGITLAGQVRFGAGAMF